ncbi:hypothetical protein NLG97_g8710 [Lecanicillium saksenae]|uniref:Uncharacterized protein n=1 Tax=Lecanicillium saksenae TaxID=468837 RepID=A0ACC1QI36_9HYPO|nr:hypothetical protein NLG97_g8710 [Lecanicillium saksenae]
MYALSRGGRDEIITLALHKWCREGRLRCVTVNPELFHHHQKVGQVASQIAVAEGWTHKAAPAGATYTANIRYSARCNSDGGNGTELVTCHSDWDDDEWR